MYNFTVFTLFYVLLSQCSGMPGRLDLTQQDDALPSTERFNFFDIELTEMISRRDISDNFVISPISVKTVLAMLLEGAKGKTNEEIRKALRLPNSSKRIKKSFKEYLTKVKREGPYQLSLANHIFTSKKYMLRQSYKKDIQEYYDAQVTPVDFKKAVETVDVINHWVNDTTRGQIPELISEEHIQPESQMLLANAVYFKGQWKYQFNTDNTQTMNFCTLPKQCVPTYMMSVSGSFLYAYINTLDADVLALPYKGEKHSMILMLPKKEDGIEQLGRDLSHTNLHDIAEELTFSKVDVKIPKFKIEFETDLVEDLKRIRIQELFTVHADLSGILQNETQSMAVSKFIHKAKIIVNEEGSEAAAVSGAAFVPLIKHDEHEFIAKRPFYFFIRDEDTGAVLFSGRLSTPEKVETYDKNDFFINKIPEETTIIAPTNFPRNTEETTIITSPRNTEEPITKSPPRKAGTIPPSNMFTGRPNGFVSTEIKNEINGQVDDKKVSKPKTTTPPPLIRTTPTVEEPGQSQTSKVRIIFTRGATRKTLFGSESPGLVGLQKDLNDIQSSQYFIHYPLNNPTLKFKRYDDRIAFV